MKKVILACALVAGASSLAAQPATVIAPGALIEGLTQSELSAQWWQWAMSAPDNISPIRDRSGVHCATGQTGKVWFLAGGYGSSKLVRTCTVPAGKSIFFPIINMSYYPDRPGTGLTCADTLGRAALNNDTAIDLFAEIDGVPVKELRRYRTRTEQCFAAYKRLVAGTKQFDGSPAASDGFWLGLAPLAKGTHKLVFGARYNRPGAPEGAMLQDIEYQLIVK